MPAVLAVFSDHPDFPQSHFHQINRFFLFLFAVFIDIINLISAFQYHIFVFLSIGMTYITI
ncbi:MAG: hypothetical protein BWK80_11765 [Desulfobacteraceae bacterium IS3]|nr:MAG: hypothetical protein BWK80_11765 [Desulfobacteraceae bacterium IS3]